MTDNTDELVRKCLRRMRNILGGNTHVVDEYGLDNLTGEFRKLDELLNPEHYADPPEHSLYSEADKIARLRSKVAKYRGGKKLPPFPKGEPAGALYGIGYIYDEDKDDRVLIAIDRLPVKIGVVAVHEHEGQLTVYSLDPVPTYDVELPGGDIWGTTNFVLQRAAGTKARDKQYVWAYAG